MPPERYESDGTLSADTVHGYLDVKPYAVVANTPALEKKQKVLMLADDLAIADWIACEYSKHSDGEICVLERSRTSHEISTVSRFLNGGVAQPPSHPGHSRIEHDGSVIAVFKSEDDALVAAEKLSYDRSGVMRVIGPRNDRTGKSDTLGRFEWGDAL